MFVKTIIRSICPNERKLVTTVSRAKGGGLDGCVFAENNFFMKDFFFPNECISIKGQIIHVHQYEMKMLHLYGGFFSRPFYQYLRGVLIIVEALLSVAPMLAFTTFQQK